MIFDLHVHTTLSSCSQLTLDEILDNARHKGLDGVCITDHQTMAVKQQTKESIQADGLCIITGMEYATPDGDFLIFGPFENIPANLPAKELLHLVDRAGGVAVAAHPFRQGRSTNPELIVDKHCLIIEGTNGRDNDTVQQHAADWQAQYSVLVVGGSDAHSLEELGKTVTVFDRPIRSRKEFIQALKSGNYHPESNPLAAR